MSAHAIPFPTKVLPPPMHSIEAEMSVLAAMVSNPELVEHATALLDESMFFRDAHRRVFRAVAAVYEETKTIAPAVLVDRIRSAGDLDAVGGVGFFAPLTGYVSSPTNIAHHARIVQKHAVRRRLAEQAEAIKHYVSHEAEAPPELLVAESEKLLSRAAPARMIAPGQGFVPAKSLLWPELERLEWLVNNPNAVPSGVRTGLAGVDEKLLALKKGDLIIVAGRPSMGKSAFGVCNIAADAAIRQQKKVAVFSIETRTDAMIRRLMGSEGRVNIWAIEKRRAFRDDDYQRLAGGTSLLNSCTLQLDYSPGLTLDQMRARLRDLVRQLDGLDLVVVDYLQLMREPRAKDTIAEVGMIGAGLKQIAGEFDVPVVALSQLSRAVESRPDKRPMLSDLRESGRLEQDADVVILLYRPEYYFPNGVQVKRGKETSTMDVTGKAEVILAKVRDGETGVVHCAWVKEYTHFEDLGGF